MQSFIIVSKNTEQAEELWEKLCAENGIPPIDQLIVESEEVLGIEVIRDIQRTIFLTPVKGQKKGILIKNAESLTIAAQNAFLKLLEEPPAHAIIVLSAANIDALIPTIQSRCFLIEVRPQNLKNEQTPRLNFSSPAQKMEIAEEFGKTRQEALNFLESQIISYRKELIKNPTSDVGVIIKKLQKAYNIVNTTNVSPRFTLENLFLEL